MDKKTASIYLNNTDTIAKVKKDIVADAIRNMGLYDYEHDLKLEIINDYQLKYTINGFDFICDDTLTLKSNISKAINETENQVEVNDTESDLFSKFSHNLSKNMPHNNQEEIARKVMFLDLPSFLEQAKVNKMSESKSIFKFLKNIFK